MAGQDATLTIAQAKAQQERICAHTEHQGPKKKGSVSSSHNEKIPHQG